MSITHLTDYPIDISNSVKRGRVVRKVNIYIKFFNTITTSAIFGIVPFGAIMNLYKNGASFGSLLFLILSATFFFLLCYSHMHMSDFTYLKGSGPRQNKDVLLTILDKEGWMFSKNNDKILAANFGYHWYSWDYGKQIVVIFCGQDVLINCICWTQDGEGSPFHWFANRKTEKRIINEFETALHYKSAGVTHEKEF